MNTLLRFFIITALIYIIPLQSQAQSGYSDVTIEEARELAPGTDVRIKGIVTRANGRFSHIQDGDAAISTFQASGNYRNAINTGDLAAGDSIIIEGTTDEFNSLFQLSGITNHTVTSRGNPLPDPAEITLSDVNESYESELIMMSGLSIDTDDAVFQRNTTYSLIENGTPNSDVTMRVGDTNDTELIGQGIPNVFTFTGVLGQFSTSGDDGYQLVPRNADDVLNEQMSEAFVLAENGVTVTCDAAIVGDTGTVNGVTYTKRTKDEITASNAATTCTSGITDMSGLFQKEPNFNEDISSWDVSSVNNMRNMFNGGFNSENTFNQPIGKWDVSNVKNMRNMFLNAVAFNQDISNWDVSQVVTMSRMFGGAEVFNQNIGGWNVGLVTTMDAMSNDAKNFNANIGEWDVSQVTTMNSMFLGAEAFNQDIGGWDVSNVTSMALMFRGAKAFDANIGGWDVSQVTDMGNMLGDAEAFNQDISGWNVSQVIDMGGMFSNAKNFNQDIGGWDVR